MFDRPADLPMSDAEADLAARLVPDQAAIDHCVRLLAAQPDPAHAFAVLPMALPGKTRGLWRIGQPVHTVPAEPRLCREYNLRGATDAADRDARAWLNGRGMTGTTAYALVMHDGAAAVFEGWR